MMKMPGYRHKTITYAIIWELDRMEKCTDPDYLSVMRHLSKFFRCAIWNEENSQRQSSPGLIAIHLNKTLVEEDLINVIVSELKKSEHSIHKVVFIGLNGSAQKLMKFTMENAGVSFSLKDEKRKIAAYTVIANFYLSKFHSGIKV